MLHFTSNLQKSLVGTAFLKAATVKMVALLSMLLFLLPTTLLANDLDKSALSNEALTAETTAEPVARAEYDKTTQTLTFLYGAPSATEDANILVVKFYNPSDNPKWFDGKYSSFDGCWNSEIKKATSVVIDDSFKNYPLASCSGMFKEFKNVITITGLGNLNTSNVTSMRGMFDYCFKLQTFDIDKLQTASVTDMANMFCNCKSLTSLDVSHFETGSVTDMSAMFKAIGDKVKSLDLSSFDTKNVESMSSMFSFINGLTSIDLTNFNTAQVTSMSYMFKATNLKHIYVSDLFKTDQVTRSGDMFAMCSDKLPNYKGSTVLDKTHANYLAGGYFEKIVGKLGDEIIAANGEPLTANTLTIDKDQSFSANEPFTVAAASYSRTMSDGNAWATLCLPFEVSLADQNFRAFKLVSANNDAVELEEVKTSVAAGMPVIIKMNAGETSLNISATNKEIAKETLTSATTDGSYQLQGLYTDKAFSKDTDNNCYIVKGDKLMNPAKLLENTNTTSVDSKPYRAYMVDKSSVQPAGAKMFSIEMDENVTAIDNLNILTNDKAAYYDIQGLRLNAPQKGVNIVKRGNKVMKVIIK